jgi:hypothetical protein
MADVEEYLGLHVGPLSFGLDARLALDGRPKSEIDQWRKESVRYARSATIDASYTAAAAQPTYGFLAFPPPTPHKVWEVFNIAVGGVDPFSAPAGQVLVAASPIVPQDSSVEGTNFGEMVYPPVGMPAVLELPRKSCIIEFPTRVLLVFKSLGNNQQIQASMFILEYDKAEYLRKLEP